MERSFDRIIDRLDPNPVISNYAYKVAMYSSEYGWHGTSYSMGNAAGPAQIYPHYGDQMKAAVFRTYGPWWKSVPSASDDFGWRNASFRAEDFIDLAYPVAVYATKVSIYETYNPGAVVRILACSADPDLERGEGMPLPRWEVVWEGREHVAPPVSRIFECNLKATDFRTRHIRVEFNSALCSYYTEIDAIYLHGCESRPADVDGASQYFASLLLEQARHVERQPLDGVIQSSVEEERAGYFGTVPVELLIYLMSFLNFPTLAVLSRTCRFLCRACSDPVFYKYLNLKSYWWKVCDATLQMLSQRSHNIIEKLDLSWCGPFQMITKSGFTRLLCEVGQNLKVLRLGCCDFLDDCSLSALGQCLLLEELDLQNAQIGESSVVDMESLRYLQALKNLRSLNLAKLPVPDHVLIGIFSACLNLEHVNLGGSMAVGNTDAADQVIITLATYCRGLRSLDLWRWRYCSSYSVLALARHSANLEELDLGWCTGIHDSANDAIPELLKGCKKIKKLFLTACRNVSGDDVRLVAASCPLLEQFDVLGSNDVDSASVESLLVRCPHLKLLDVSFCSQITAEDVEAWTQKFSYVDIKKSGA